MDSPPVVEETASRHLWTLHSWETMCRNTRNKSTESVDVYWGEERLITDTARDAKVD